MLVVRVEIWPGGHPDRRREIGLLALANVSDLDAESDYVVIRAVGQHVCQRSRNPAGVGVGVQVIPHSGVQVFPQFWGADERRGVHQFGSQSL
jgi:hypothetical protein